ncbi:MAG: glycosyl hydrolase family 28 protein [Clostridiales bacterium]|nr:glycosyl hydrolase family 28 protein [Clostridiales bacterium]
MKFNILTIPLLAMMFSCSNDDVKGELTPVVPPVTEYAFKVEVAGEDAKVYEARVSKFPANDYYNGTERPLTQTEIAYFASFDYEDGQTIKVTTDKDISTVDIRPTEFGIVPKVEDRTIEFSVNKPCQIVVEVNGHHQALHIFANPKGVIEAYRNEGVVRYYGPGDHNIGTLTLNSNETVYIDEGAVCYGVIKSENTSNINIVGKGILDASRVAKNAPDQPISLHKVKNAYIGGIILRDPQSWGIVPTCCDNLTIDNVKLVGLWRYNSDGIDIVNCSNITVKNSFIRSFDDCITIKGLQWVYDTQKISEHIRIDNCVLWNDWGKIIEFGAETMIDEIRDVKVSNCYVPHYTMAALDMQNGDLAHISDIEFENISIEEPITDSASLSGSSIDTSNWGRAISLGIYNTQYSTEKEKRGKIDNVRFKNIRCIGSRTYPRIELKGYGPNNQVTNIHIKDYYVNGKKVTGKDAIDMNGYVDNVVLE